MICLYTRMQAETHGRKHRHRHRYIDRNAHTHTNTLTNTYTHVHTHTHIHVSACINHKTQTHAYTYTVAQFISEHSSNQLKTRKHAYQNVENEQYSLSKTLIVLTLYQRHTTQEFLNEKPYPWNRRKILGLISVFEIQGKVDPFAVVSLLCLSWSGLSEIYQVRELVSNGTALGGRRRDSRDMSFVLRTGKDTRWCGFCCLEKEKTICVVEGVLSNADTFCDRFSWTEIDCRICLLWRFLIEDTLFMMHTKSQILCITLN